MTSLLLAQLSQPEMPDNPRGAMVVVIGLVVAIALVAIARKK